MGGRRQPASAVRDVTRELGSVEMSPGVGPPRGSALISPACGRLPKSFTESMVSAGVDGSKTDLEKVAIKGVLLGGGKRSSKYLKTTLVTQGAQCTCWSTQGLPSVGPDEAESLGAWSKPETSMKCFQYSFFPGIGLFLTQGLI